jgi:hypothetical protein
MLSKEKPQWNEKQPLRFSSRSADVAQWENVFLVCVGLGLIATHNKRFTVHHAPEERKWRRNYQSKKKKKKGTLQDHEVWQT